MKTIFLSNLNSSFHSVLLDKLCVIFSNIRPASIFLVNFQRPRNGYCERFKSGGWQLVITYPVNNNKLIYGSFSEFDSLKFYLDSFVIDSKFGTSKTNRKFDRERKSFITLQ